jgi:HEPN domain-containing protein
MEKSQVLLSSAKAFEVIARQVNLGGINLESHSVLIASSVNAALSLEYLAKYLSFISTGKYERTHNLRKILKGIPLDLYNQLKNEYEKVLTEEEVNRAKITSEASGVSINEDFDSAIHNWSSVFVDGRYWFEPEKGGNGKSFHWFFFDPLTLAFKQVIEDIKKVPT